MKDKAFRNFALICGGIALLWWLHERNVEAAQAADNAQAPTPQTSDNPIDQVFSSNPSAFTPQTLPNSTINVDVSNQGLGMLSNQYIPLFGFVGMEQGMGFQ
jgi:hypothetical protein